VLGGGEGPKELSMIYPNMTPANALKSGGMNEMQYYSAVKYDDSIANGNAKNNDAQKHLNQVLASLKSVAAPYCIFERQKKFDDI